MAAQTRGPTPPGYAGHFLQLVIEQLGYAGHLLQLAIKSRRLRYPRH
jgi:hypothetical protein